jgi:hypothetical protein
MPQFPSSRLSAEAVNARLKKARTRDSFNVGWKIKSLLYQAIMDIIRASTI